MGAPTDKNEIQQKRLKVASFAITGAANTTDGKYYMLAQLANASGKWKHAVPASGKGFKIFKALAKAYSATAADNYFCQLGVVLRADATNADVALFPVDGLVDLFPSYLDLTVASGVCKNIYATKAQTSDTGVQTDVNVTDEQGNNVLPVAGDLVFRVKGVAAAGNIAFASMTVWYDVF